MAIPMSADQFVKALRDEGLTVVEREGWRTHNRNHRGPWGPVHGVVIHHTAGTPPSDYNVVWNGQSDEVPGPLCQSYMAPTGAVTMVGNGRSNHAGGGDPAVLEAVKNESYDTSPPASRFHDGSAGAADGNRCFYGLEASSPGEKNSVYPAAQYQAIVKWAAAICRFHGWTAKSVIGHKEWSNWKPDPTYSMVQFRKDVQALLDRDPSKPQVPPVVTVPPKPQQPKYEPYPGAGFFSDGRKSPIIAAMHARLVAVGCNKYESQSGKDVWGSGDEASYRAWQRKNGFSGTGADGTPGRLTWDLLRVPNV